MTASTPSLPPVRQRTVDFGRPAGLPSTIGCAPRRCSSCEGCDASVHFLRKKAGSSMVEG
eukprot:6177832-Pleurochrysis_carterae.AAC.2